MNVPVKMGIKTKVCHKPKVLNHALATTHTASNAKDNRLVTTQQTAITVQNKQVRRPLVMATKSQRIAAATAATFNTDTALRAHSQRLGAEHALRFGNDLSR